jgi:hypothetical protein
MEHDEKSQSIERLDSSMSEFERQSILVEREKLQVERYKARWTAFSLAVPLFAAVLTIAFGIWSSYQQSKSAFEIKAAELVMSTDFPQVTAGKAATLQTLFPRKLSPDFARAFDPDTVSSDDPAKKELIHLLAERPGKGARVIWEAAGKGARVILRTNRWTSPRGSG